MDSEEPWRNKAGAESKGQAARFDGLNANPQTFALSRCKPFAMIRHMLPAREKCMQGRVKKYAQNDPVNYFFIGLIFGYFNGYPKTFFTAKPFYIKVL